MVQTKSPPNGGKEIVSAWSAYVGGPVGAIVDETRLIDVKDQYPARSTEEHFEQLNEENIMEDNFEWSDELKRLFAAFEKANEEHELVKDKIGQLKAATNEAWARKAITGPQRVIAKANFEGALAREKLGIKPDARSVPARRFEVDKGVRFNALIPESTYSGLRQLGEKNGTNMSEEMRRAVDERLAHGGASYVA